MDGKARMTESNKRDPVHPQGIPDMDERHGDTALE